MDENDDLKVRYKPPFPLNIIFPKSILIDYEHIWNLLLRIAAECSALEVCFSPQNRFENFKGFSVLKFDLLNGSLNSG